MNNKKIDLKTIEDYHNKGMIPDRYYYQINGKTTQENYMEHIKNRNHADIIVIIDGVAEQIVDNIIRDALKTK